MSDNFFLKYSNRIAFKRYNFQEITGVMPKEIYKTLMPGESEPKVKRRVGTSYKFGDDLFKKAVDTVSGANFFYSVFFIVNWFFFLCKLSTRKTDFSLFFC